MGRAEGADRRVLVAWIGLGMEVGSALGLDWVGGVVGGGRERRRQADGGEENRKADARQQRRTARRWEDEEGCWRCWRCWTAGLWTERAGALEWERSGGGRPAS